MVRPEADMARINAMTALGNGLDLEGKFEERLAVFKSQLAMLPRVGASQEHVLGNQGNTATCLSAHGRYEEAMKITVRIYSGMKALNGPRNEFTILSAANLASSLEDNERKAAALSLAAEYLPIAESVLGPHDITTLRLRKCCLRARIQTGASLDDVREVMSSCEDLHRTAIQVLGSQHPFTELIKDDVEVCRKGIARTEARMATLAS
jgi:hypothetical protein